MQNQQKHRNILLIMTDHEWEPEVQSEKTIERHAAYISYFILKVMAYSMYINYEVYWKLQNFSLCCNDFRGYYNGKMLSDTSLEEARSKRTMKQARKFPKYPLLWLPSALELREKHIPTSSTSRAHHTFLRSAGEWIAAITQLICKDIWQFKIYGSRS